MGESRYGIQSTFYLLLIFGLAPEGVQFFLGRILGATSGRIKLLLYPLKAAFEFAIRLLQRRFRVERQVARHVYDNEKQITDFFFEPLLQLRGNRWPSGSSNAARMRPRSGRGILTQLGSQLFWSSSSLSNRPSMFGQSKPVAAALVLNLCASSKAGMADELQPGWILAASSFPVP